jgi:hypothetical protein
MLDHSECNSENGFGISNMACSHNGGSSCIYYDKQC